jgi:hypothetical protein
MATYESDESKKESAKEAGREAYRQAHPSPPSPAGPDWQRIDQSLPTTAAPTAQHTQQGWKTEVWRGYLTHLLVAATVGIASYAWATVHAQRKLEEAPTIYVNQLDTLIKNGVAEGEENAILNAKAIVAARNSLARSLTAMGAQLDSQIDILATTIGADTLSVPTQTPAAPKQMSSEGSRSSRNPKSPPAVEPPTPTELNHQTYQQILVLSKIWPAKKRQIEIEIRKLLAELGLYGSSDHQAGE